MADTPSKQAVSLEETHLAVGVQGDGVLPSHSVHGLGSERPLLRAGLLAVGFLHRQGIGWPLPKLDILAQLVLEGKRRGVLKW